MTSARANRSRLENRSILSMVSFLGRLSHPNLVKLLGYCHEAKELVLVYEFRLKGSLDNQLYGRCSAALSRPWNVRLKIVIGAARGLAFLHSSEKQVNCRDFKTSNILLVGCEDNHILTWQK
ncbi:probable serine/threonine-protein kinase PIX13 [Capsicum annuum]|uniref:probable serine/threonine-protein kinase PIX13 n=1 Tax=Capsicum annuum TaxID=4072 RepID=UPI001FB13E90|nr:probable serine/threonine-protein kinase PIX13 [Capsicum annuum]